jgi:hypothetical protein
MIIISVEASQLRFELKSCLFSQRQFEFLTAFPRTVSASGGLLFQLTSTNACTPTEIPFQLVGMLIRARKHGLLHFEGEMLYQRQDEKKTITLLKPIQEIYKIEHSGDPARLVAPKS